MEFIMFLDTILVPLSLFITIGYHAYLYSCLKYKPTTTIIGLNIIKRRSWLQDYNQGDDKKGMLAVQSLRNTLMATILTATVTMTIVASLAALTNNAFNAAHHFHNVFLGLHSGRFMVLKFGCSSVFLIGSFACSSMAVGCLVDANFLINAPPLPFSHTLSVFEQGFTLAFVGNRMLCVGFTMLFWLFGPLAVFVSSVALVWGLHGLDFIGDLSRITVSNTLSVSNLLLSILISLCLLLTKQ